MLRVRRKSNPIFLQNKTGKADAKSVWIGGDHPVVVQSMTTTDTADADKTLEQIYGLAMEGCEVVRVTVKDPPDAAGLPAIVYRSPVPIVADIHFDHKMALAAIEAGVAKLRLNPGNIRDPKKVVEVVTAAKARGIPIRVGVNMGSLAPDLEKIARAHRGGDGSVGVAPRRDPRRARAYARSRFRSRRTTWRRPSRPIA